ncbi:MAG: hypothetical protein AAFZ15_34360 [Bacteroidota bacterium]
MATTKGLNVYVLQSDCKVLGTWSNLKKLCEEMKEEDSEFLSYSSLSKKKAEENPIVFETSAGIEYELYVEKVK